MKGTARCKCTGLVSDTKLTASSSTFLKRKGGLFKKAHELSVLCSVEVAVVIFGQNKKLFEYSSGDIHEILRRHQYVSLHLPSTFEQPADFQLVRQPA